jgi:predicted GH43/DUF377 family glycosyl hydrolase
MEPNAGDPLEAGGVLNPACARGPDGQLYLFPRLVAERNYSRIGIARVVFEAAGDPVSVERLGVALEPTEPYEKNDVTGGGCEDPRVSYIASLECYLMTYTALSPVGPRIAVAVSQDLLSWERVGLVRFAAEKTLHLEDAADNKDAVLFPSPITDPRTGNPALALLHRPTVVGSRNVFVDPWWGPRAGPADARSAPRTNHPSVWISYSNGVESVDDLCLYQSHHRLLSPRESWERVKVGAGAPPLLTPHGWLLLYHGVAHRSGHFRYSAGAALLDTDDPRRVLYRTRRPILIPGADDQLGVVPGVVFPTATDQRMDLGTPNRVDVYYGMADSRIGVASLTLPHILEVSPPSKPRLSTSRPRANPVAPRSSFSPG